MIALEQTSVEKADHRELRGGEFWRHIPKFRDVDEATFLDHIWQGRNSVKTPEELLDTIKDLAPTTFIDDARAGFSHAPMAVRVSPYMLSLIDWNDPYADPIRRQFIPLRSTMRPDHPRLTLDSLHERQDAPVPGLVHRYTDKALFIALQTCPVYCRFCTRSYAIGPNTSDVEKVHLTTPAEWQRVFTYIAAHPELEDIVISGGDTYQLPPRSITQIGEALLAIPHVRRMRFATKGPAVMPMKLLTDEPWLDALEAVAAQGRKLGKEVAVHTHFNHPSEITQITQRAMQRLFERAIYVRNQTVLMRGVNDDEATMELLVKRLSYVNVHPYYVYMHDLVKGVEELRTSVSRAIEIEKYVRGATAGFNTPTFVCDAPGGGGKRDVHSYEYYDRENGISVYTAPSVKPGKFFLYFDPIEDLVPQARARWTSSGQQEMMISSALAAAGATRQDLVTA
jgi:lysine 2,3-aminomutase